MGKFKVGDRVLAKNRGYENGEHEGEIVHFDDYSYLVEFSDGWKGGHDAIIGDDRNSRWYFQIEDLSPLPVAAETAGKWQPKVGDRVVEATGKKYDLAKHWRDYWERTEGKLTGNAFVVVQVEGNQVRYSNRVDGKGPWVTSADLEPLPVAAEAQPLVIAAGRYYKTRDGRKVGPVAQKSGYMEAGGYHYSNTGECCFLGQSGDDTYPEFDLIAEWVDEPAVAPAVAVAATASNDNAPVASAATKGKFKVGDEVRHKSLGYEGTIKEILDGEIARTYWPKKGWGASDPFEDLELISASAPAPTAIVALIENGQPKPSSRPYVHATEEAASKEAARLAGIHKGQQFGVYVLAQTVSEEKPTFKHEWQRLAADGQKIAAIKELRSIASLDLLTAKQAVERFVDKAA